jgi:hypothetical protein
LTILNRPNLQHVTFVRTCKEKQYFNGYNILTEGVFVTQLSGEAEISVSRIVWLKTNCRFMSDKILDIDGVFETPSIPPRISPLDSEKCNLDAT